MIDSDTDSDREGQQFFYDNLNNIVYLKDIRQRNIKSKYFMHINNAYYFISNNNKIMLKQVIKLWRDKSNKKNICFAFKEFIVKKFLNRRTFKMSPYIIQ